MALPLLRAVGPMINFGGRLAGKAEQAYDNWKMDREIREIMKATEIAQRELTLELVSPVVSDGEEEEPEPLRQTESRSPAGPGPGTTAAQKRAPYGSAEWERDLQRQLELDRARERGRESQRERNRERRSDNKPDSEPRQALVVTTVDKNGGKNEGYIWAMERDRNRERELESEQERRREPETEPQLLATPSSTEKSLPHGNAEWEIELDRELELDRKRYLEREEEKQRRISPRMATEVVQQVGKHPDYTADDLDESANALQPGTERISALLEKQKREVEEQRRETSRHWVLRREREQDSLRDWNRKLEDIAADTQIREQLIPTQIVEAGVEQQEMERTTVVRVANDAGGGSMVTGVRQHFVLDSDNIDDIVSLPPGNQWSRSLTEPHTILLVNADVGDQSSLRLHHEEEAIRAALSSSRYRNSYNLQTLPVCRYDSLISAVQRWRPSILHFSGHGVKDGLCLVGSNGQSEILDSTGLEAILRVGKRRGLKAVILNTCWSDSLGAAAAGIVGSSISMRGVVADLEAAVWTGVFYQSLGDGESFHEAWEVALTRIIADSRIRNDVQPVLNVVVGV